MGKKTKSTVLTIFTAVIFATSSACAEQQSSPPELLFPVGVKADTAKVTRGNVELMEQYQGIVRVESESLHFGVTGLRFSEYFCLEGQSVEKGQLLAQLDTEDIDRQISQQQKKIEQMVIENSYENELLELEYAIAGADMTSKSLEVERRRLAIAHALEQQELEIGYAESYLDELLAHAEKADMRAPMDGVVTYRVEKYHGDSVEPYTPLIYISDLRNMFVEIAETSPIIIPRDAKTVCLLNGREYELERMTISKDDMVFYNSLRLIPPIRFNAVSPDEYLTIGACVTIHVYSSIAENVLRVPVNALNTDVDGNNFVYVQENGTKTIRNVKIGLQSPVFVEISAGLEEGEEVYVN